MNPSSVVELRPRRLWLVLSGLLGIGVVAYAVWAGGVVAWLGVAVGSAFTAGNGYWLLRDKPRISLSEDGIEWGFEWSRRRLTWSEIESMRELRSGSLLTRRHLRLLAIRTVGNVRGTRLDRMLHRADFTINISALEQSAQAVLALVERVSGRKVERVR